MATSALDAESIIADAASFLVSAAVVNVSSSPMDMSMSTELTLLAWSAALAFVQMCSTAGFITLTQGFAVSLGNRAGFAPEEGALTRAIRAHRNMVESFAVFAAVVLVAHVAGRENWLTTLGAELFLFGRLAYAALYIAGVAYLRTIAWTVAITGILLVLVPVLT